MPYDTMCFRKMGFKNIAYLSACHILGSGFARVTAVASNLHEGAFSPFSQQPVVRALLLPLGSFGWMKLLENGLLLGLY